MISINKKNLYRYFFYFFLLSIPLQGRKVFLTEYSFYTGSFTEYGTVFLYISDIFLSLSILSLWLFNKDLIKKALSEIKKDKGIQKILSYISIFCIWLLISTAMNNGFWQISFFRSLKYAEMLALILLIITILSEKKYFISSLYIIIISAFFQSIIAIYQFIFQKSLFLAPFLHKISGETILSQDGSGVAKVISYSGEKLVRSYGTLPHPNILASFLFFSFFISLFLYKEHKYHYLSSSISPKIKQKQHKKPFNSLFWTLIFSAQLFALAFSFSRSAWIAFFLSLLILITLFYKKIIVSCETITGILNKNKELFISLFFFIILISTNRYLFINRIFQDTTHSNINVTENFLPQNNTFNDRVFFNNVSRETIQHTPIIGSGPGTSIFQIKEFLTTQNINHNIESWQFQPAHNIFLLISSETGIIGLFIFLLIIISTAPYSFKNIVSRETIEEEKTLKRILLCILIGFIFLGLFDHYFITSQQGQLIFWIVIGLLLLKIKEDNWVTRLLKRIKE
ncbi:MAG: O-antigen ligase family protein [Candidatus Pacebacteria bacterium]|nr:O-antigen ligase family protein [Candidatus Paceibacterota bacterium]